MSGFRLERPDASGSGLRIDEGERPVLCPGQTLTTAELKHLTRLRRADTQQQSDDSDDYASHSSLMA